MNSVDRVALSAIIFADKDGSAHLSPIIALIAGILILFMPRLLNYVVAFYLIAVGLIGLNGIYHFIH
jgi:Protein of unknown function (DUF3096)